MSERPTCARTGCPTRPNGGYRYCSKHKPDDPRDVIVYYDKNDKKQWRERRPWEQPVPQ